MHIYYAMKNILVNSYSIREAAIIGICEQLHVGSVGQVTPIVGVTSL